MFYDTDNDTFFLDFAIDITYNGTSIKGIHTPAGVVTTFGKQFGFITTENELVVKSSDCPAVKKTDSIVIDGQTYHPYQPQPDGTGFTKMYLALNVR